MMPYDAKTIMWQLSFPMSEDEAKILSKKWSEALRQEGIDRLWDWHSPIPEILKTTDTSFITGYPVYDREVMKPEFLKNLWDITLLGDAMHPMSPFKGQGANQAILDALDLARDIATKCGPDSNWREQWLRKTVLEDFEAKVLKRSALKVRDSAEAVKLLHSDAVLHDGDSPRGRGI
jgi:2-polyprenyl-6-methoxyphenol hydroxylase-like FAD-dependent oxidoreductase